MPDETGRTTKNKKVQLPGGATVLVPVIAQINFQDPTQRGQEFQYTIDNSGKADRDIHVAWVGGQGSTNATENADPSASTPSDCLAVERIDVWRTVDPTERGQETRSAPDNKTYDPSGPPYFTTHKKTRVVRYVNNPDDGNWIESELIDEIAVIDPVEQGQETDYTLNNPPGTDDGHGNLIVQADTSADDITDAGNGVDAPWRLDPFQNIVRIGAGWILVVRFTWNGTGVTITTDADPSIILSNAMGTSGDDQTFTFNIKTMPKDSDFKIGFSISGQGDYTYPDLGPPIEGGPDLVGPGWTTLFPGTTQLVAPFTPPQGYPWVITDVALYPKSGYPGNAPVSFFHFSPAGSLGNYISTLQASDQSNYLSPPSTTLITGGTYSIVGLIDGGSLTVSMQNLADQSGPPAACWPSTPTARDVDYVYGTGSAAPPGYGVDPSNGINFIPNPPPPWRFGLYFDGHHAYESGEPPLPPNRYDETTSGPYPPVAICT